VYGILEHSYYRREAAGDDPTHGGVFKFRPAMAPIKVALLPLSGNPAFNPPIKDLERQLIAFNLVPQIDAGGASVGKRYARADEIGVPFGVTVDFKTLEDKTVTIRERDTTQQVRVPIKEAVLILAQLLTETMTWQEAYDKYPRQARPAGEE